MDGVLGGGATDERNPKATAYGWFPLPGLPPGHRPLSRARKAQRLSREPDRCDISKSLIRGDAHVVNRSRFEQPSHHRSRHDRACSSFFQGEGQAWNNFVLKYFSPRSGKMTTMFPEVIFLAVSAAANMAAPLLMPTKIPSLRAISRAIS